MRKIVIINGGRGATEIIPYLLNKNTSITSLVNAYDDGKSTGVLRNYFKTLGPSDLRKVIKLMFGKKDKYFFSKIDLFDYRFPKKNNQIILSELDNFLQFKKNSIFDLSILPKDLSKFLIIKLKKFIEYYYKYKKINKYDLIFADLSLINCILVTLFLENKNKVDIALKKFMKVLKINSKILINSNSIRYLVALRKSGSFLNSEAEIVESRSNIKIHRIYLLKKKLNKNLFKEKNLKKNSNILKNLNSNPTISNEAYKSIINANIIIYCPGTQHSSLYPTYTTKNFKNALLKNKKAKKIFITNIGADYETPKYDSFDYIQGAYNYITNFDNKKKFNDYFNLVLINKPKYKFKINYVKLNTEPFIKHSINFITGNFENHNKPGSHDINKIKKYIL